jgi:hypothetical protein
MTADINTTKERTTGYNSTYPKVAVQCLNQALCFYQILCLVDSELLRNRQLRQHANRYEQRERTEPQQSKANLWQVKKC